MTLKILATANFVMMCLVFGQWAQASQDVCSALQGRYALPASLREATAGEAAAIYTAVDEVFSRVRVDSSLSGFDMRKFNQQVRSVQICVNLSNQALIGSGTRKGSVYFTKEKAIVFNLRELSLHDNRGGALMVIHEFLGALGYPDQNYEITTFLYSSLHKDSFGTTAVRQAGLALKQHLQQAPALRDNVKFLKSDGGVSGVGGGGDSEVVLVKALVLNSVILNIDTIQGDFSAAELARLPLYILRYKIETDSVQSPKILKKVSDQLSYMSVQNSLGILMQAGAWEKLLAKGAQGLDERTQFITLVGQMILNTYKVDLRNENK